MLQRLPICRRAVRVDGWRRATRSRHLGRSFSVTACHGSVAQKDEALAESIRTRNIGIIAHIDAGKTTTTERMLYYSGFTRRIGDVDDGSTVTDFLPAERARGITIQSAAITFHWPPTSPDSVASALTVPRLQTSHTINLIDTPGHADFTFEVLRSLRILDGAVCILDGVAGVEAQTEKVWHQASKYQIPRIIYVNKLDREGAAFGNTVKEIGTRLAGWPAVCQIPWLENGGAKFVGIGDVVGLCGMRWEDGGDGKTVKMHSLAELDTVNKELAQEIRRARVALVELLSEHDDIMVEKFLEHDEDHLTIPAVEIKESLRRLLLGGSMKIIPVFAGASFRNIGVQPLLDAVVDLLPGPTERPDPNVSVGSFEGGLQELLDIKIGLELAASSVKKQKQKKSLAVHETPAMSLVRGLESCALAFKVANDSRRGVLVYVRVYSGTLNRNALLFNTNLQIAERAPRILKMYAGDAVEISSIPAGQIGVIVGLKHARTGDTLISYSGSNPKTGPPTPLNTLQLRPIDVPPPVFFASVEPASPSEEKHLNECLAILLREDPSLHITVDEDSGQTLLSGMGELHLEIARDRLVNDFRAKAEMGNIEIGYRETILNGAGPAHVLFDREVAGRKGKAGCTASVEPLAEVSAELDTIDESHEDYNDETTSTVARDGNQITVRIPALLEPDHTALPAHLPSTVIHDSLTQGALAALSRGPTHFYPAHSVSVSVTFDPETDIHGPATTPAALMSAARLAVRDALSLAATSSSAVGAGSALMEPVMTVLISVNEASLGAVVHDLSSARSAHVLSLSASDDNESSSQSSSPVIPADKIYAPPDPFASSSTSSAAATAMHNQHRTITARVPLREMVGYLKHLRSLTGGRGTFVMSVDRFERVSKQREKGILAGLRSF